MQPAMNQQWLLVERPIGMPQLSNFELKSSSIPELKENELLIRIVYLSLDPYMRGLMRETASYVEPVPIGKVMQGGGVGKVILSNHPDFAVGDIVEGRLNWQSYALSDGENLRKVDPSLAPISTANGVLGMPGMTAYFGLLEIGKPQAGETLVVSAASGAVGALVGQIARIKKCRVVGIVGSEQKKCYILDELGFDAAINYHESDELGAALRNACPNGIDIYFDNVGGPILDAALSLINTKARIPICGMISEYNLEKPQLVARPTRQLLIKCARMEGFLVFQWLDQYPEGIAQMAQWLQQGKVKYKEDITQGLENAPQTFINLLSGKNFGKCMIQVSEA